MAKVCHVTGRKAVTGNNRSHAMNYSKRRFGANLQKSASQQMVSLNVYGFQLVH